MESIKGCFVNSLEMATYIEDKCTEKIKNEMKKKDRVISLLQDENNSLLKKIRENEVETNNRSKELEDTKESFSRVNLALTTVEKELNEKAKIIENLQLHISSLSEVTAENRSFKEENANLKEKLRILEAQLTESKIDSQSFEYLKKENERYTVEIAELRKERNEYKEYSNGLNKQIQEILLEKANEIAKINLEKDRVLKEYDEINTKELKEANDIINKLKDELYEIKLTMNQTKMGK